MGWSMLARDSGVTLPRSQATRLWQQRGAAALVATIAEAAAAVRSQFSEGEPRMAAERAAQHSKTDSLPSTGGDLPPPPTPSPHTSPTRPCTHAPEVVHGARVQEGEVGLADRDVLGRRVGVQLLVPLLQEVVLDALRREGDRGRGRRSSNGGSSARLRAAGASVRRLPAHPQPSGPPPLTHPQTHPPPAPTGRWPSRMPLARMM